jgi:hypothetical protein
MKENKEYQRQSYSRRRAEGQKPVTVWLTKDEWETLEEEKQRTQRPISYLLQRVASLYVESLKGENSK